MSAKKPRCKKCGRHYKKKSDAKECAKTCQNRSIWNKEKRAIKQKNDIEANRI